MRRFVETKKARLGKGTKASHLAYLGDATPGDDVSVGTNSTLVAPVTIETMPI